MTDREVLRLALATLDEVRSETFRLVRNGERLYAEEKVWNTVIVIKERLAQPEQEPMAWINAEKRTFEWNGPVLWNTPTVAVLDKIPLYTHPPQRTEPICPECKAEVLYECVACSSNNYPKKETT